MTNCDRLWLTKTDYDQLWQIMTDFDRLWQIMTDFLNQHPTSICSLLLVIVCWHTSIDLKTFVPHHPSLQKTGLFWLDVRDWQNIL